MFFALFAGPIDTWRPAISALFIFSYFLFQIKKKDFSDADAIKHSLSILRS